MPRQTKLLVNGREVLWRGENLIFLISQPRAGSTLLQRMLSLHSDIHTVSEPWLMLHPSYGLRDRGHQAEYDEQLAKVAVESFLEEVEEGEETFFEGMALMYSYLYENALSKSHKRYFLDKTPRYYLILRELHQTFPEAKFIILFRNPISVLSSILETWVKKDFNLLYRFKDDLIKAPDLLLNGRSLLGQQCTVVHYERLVLNAKEELQRVCEMIGIEFEEQMLGIHNKNTKKWKFGDQSQVYEKREPDIMNIDKWVQRISDPGFWQLMHDYIHMLGEQTVTDMGYSYDDFLGIIEKNQPGNRNRWNDGRLQFWLREPYPGQAQWMRGLLRLGFLVKKRGFRKAMRAIYNETVRSLSRSLKH